MRKKPNYKTVDLSAPLWVPKVGEMYEYRHPVSLRWTRCAVKSIENDDSGKPIVAVIGYESVGCILKASYGLESGSLRESRTAPASKLDQLAVLMKTGQWEKALLFAAKFPTLGDQKKAIEKAANAIKNPDLYVAMKQTPDDLVKAGISALRERFATKPRKTKENATTGR